MPSSSSISPRSLVNSPTPVKSFYLTCIVDSFIFYYRFFYFVLRTIFNKRQLEKCKYKFIEFSALRCYYSTTNVKYHQEDGGGCHEIFACGSS